MPFYNSRRMTQPGTVSRTSSDLSVLTKVALTDVRMRSVSSIHDLRLRVAESVNDPVYRLLQSGDDAAEMTAGWGVKVELAFSMEIGRVVAPFRRAHDTPLLGRMLRDSRTGV